MLRDTRVIQQAAHSYVATEKNNKYNFGLKIYRCVFKMHMPIPSLRFF